MKKFCSYEECKRLTDAGYVPSHRMDCFVMDPDGNVMESEYIMEDGEVWAIEEERVEHIRKLVDRKNESNNVIDEYKSDIVAELTDIEVLETLYSILDTPISRRKNSDDFNKLVLRLGEYIKKIKKDEE